MTTFGDRGHDHLRDDPPLSTADMAQAGGRAQAETAQAQASSSRSDAPARTTQPGPERMSVGHAGTDAGPGPAPGPGSTAPAASAGASPVAGAPAGASAATSAAATSDDDGRTPLFADERSSEFRARWTDVQAGFVDEPRSAVEQADGLVAEVMQQLAKTFAEERTRLEAEWERQGDVSTEDLRQALRRYRSFFDRLLTL
jgi:hypothetical protein